MKKCLIILCAMTALTASAQLKVEKLLKYDQETTPVKIDNYHYSLYYTDSNSGYNLRGFKISPSGVKVRDIKVNPAGYSVAYLSGSEKKGKVLVSPVNDPKEKHQVQGLANPSAISFSSDSRFLNITDLGTLKVFDSKTLAPVREFTLEYDATPIEIAMSSNDYLLGVKYPNRLDIYNYETGRLRQSLPTAQGFSWAFTDAADLVGTLTPDGNLTIYSTADFVPQYVMEGVGRNTGNLFFYPQGNYAGFIDDSKDIKFVNLFNPVDRPTLSDTGTSLVRFVTDDKGNLYLAATRGKEIIYRQLSGFSENFGLLANKMVEDLMAEWSKMRPGETEEQYRLRVNEASMKAKSEEFYRQVSTDMALSAGLGAFGDITLGQYNPADGTLIVNIGSLMEPICLKVPLEDMENFGDGLNLQFSNQVFILTAENSFKLIYVEVFNPTNGKTYVYDNPDGTNLDFLNLDDGFISLDLIMQSKREDVILQGIKDRIIEDARKKNLLTDYTTFEAEPRIRTAVDADGRKIKNYVVDISYQVAPEGSAKEDFAPGKYKISDSPAAESLLGIIAEAFRGEFATYIVPGKKLIVTIVGSADALPINRSLPYDGSLGEFENEPCSVNGMLTSLSVSSAKGITTNEQLGFMRARSLQHQLVENVPEIAAMDVTYRNNIDVANEKGAQFRRIKVSLEFVDAF